MSTAIASPSMNCAELAERLLVEHLKRNSSQSTRPANAPFASKPGDRRRNPRRRYACWHLVAEYAGRLYPVQEDFQLRLCQDISASGISFLAHERPRCHNLVIALGPIPFVFFHIQFSRAIRRKDLEGQPLQIGCRFVKRILG